MYKIYWTTNAGAAHGQEMQDLGLALTFSNDLRKDGHRFVTIVGENPNCTSLPGAAIMEREDYHWKKRRR